MEGYIKKYLKVKGLKKTLKVLKKELKSKNAISADENSKTELEKMKILYELQKDLFLEHISSEKIESTEIEPLKITSDSSKEKSSKDLGEVTDESDSAQKKSTKTEKTEKAEKTVKIEEKTNEEIEANTNDQELEANSFQTPPVKESFKRVKFDMKGVDERLKNNSYNPKMAYGKEAFKQFSGTRGKDFRKEKTKRKKGNYRGGKISCVPNSYKFD